MRNMWRCKCPSAHVRWLWYHVAGALRQGLLALAMASIPAVCRQGLGSTYSLVVLLCRRHNFILVSGLFFLTTAPFPFVPAFPMMGESTVLPEAATAAGSSAPLIKFACNMLCCITPCALIVAESSHQSVTVL